MIGESASEVAVMRNSTSSPGWKAAGRTSRLMTMEGGGSSDCQDGDGFKLGLPAISSLLVCSRMICCGCAVTSAGVSIGRREFVEDIMALLDSWLVWRASWIVPKGDRRMRQQTTGRVAQSRCGRIALRMDMRRVGGHAARTGVSP